MDSAKLKLGIVGYGHIAKKHIAAIEQLSDDWVLSAVADQSHTALRSAMAEQAVDGYNSLGELLAQANVDAVSLCTPSGTHAWLAQQVASAGHHVITEKPMATRFADGQAMLQACDRAGVELFIVHQNRFNPTLQLLKQAIDGGHFGRIYHVNCNVYWTRPQDYYDKASWRGSWEMDGGALMNQASHYVDILPWLFGPIDCVQAMSATLARQIETEDTAIANIRWRNGLLGSLNVTMLAYPKNFEGSLTILGERGTVKIGGLAVNEIVHWDFAESFVDETAITAANEATTQQLGQGHLAFYQHVQSVLRGEQCSQLSGREGLKTLECLTALYRSARDGQTVPLPLVL